jgi:predicted dehydrogenase
MFLGESKAFLNSVRSGIRDRNNIEQVLETAKLLDALYQSANDRKEITF